MTVRLPTAGGRAIVASLWPDAVDLSAHKDLMALPEELRRCGASLRELTVAGKERWCVYYSG